MYCYTDTINKAWRNPDKLIRELRQKKKIGQASRVSSVLLHSVFSQQTSQTYAIAFRLSDRSSQLARLSLTDLVVYLIYRSFD